MQGDAQAGLKHLKAAQEANPDVLAPPIQMALLYTECDDLHNAKAWMEYAFMVVPFDLKTWLLAAQWSIETGQLDLAKYLAGKALNIDRKSVEALVMRGVVALYRRDFQAAERYFGTAHVQSPNNFAPINNLALALCEQNNQNKKRRALLYAQFNARTHPESAEALSTLGWVYYHLGRVDDAERALRKSTARGRFSADTAYYLARVCADRGKNDEAKRFLEAALKPKRFFCSKQEAEALLKKLSE